MSKSSKPEENIMIRKSLLALTAVGALGAAALAPTSASAWGFHGGGFGHHWGHGFGVGFVGGPTYVTVAPDCYYVKKITRSGFVKIIKVCE